ncbi:serpin B8-like [Tropilaelaps mercedesae]|uniref:Serpin B8-like n=1 Tax=Tropilaelaps mercedesae TaxID=418985 RepID=A0A1V9XVF3_9ACAR|nr:serpin B8-like [Tropilaelaps mercedesae]
MNAILLGCCFLGLSAAAGPPRTSIRPATPANVHNSNKGNNSQGLSTTKAPEYDFVFAALGKAIRAANSSNNLALELFKRVVNQDNVFIAPFSVSTVLSMAYQGSAGRTAEEMAKVLGVVVEHSCMKNATQESQTATDFALPKI